MRQCVSVLGEAGLRKSNGNPGEDNSSKEKGQGRPCGNVYVCSARLVLASTFLICTCSVIFLNVFIVFIMVDTIIISIMTHAGVLPTVPCVYMFVRRKTKHDSAVTRNDCFLLAASRHAALCRTHMKLLWSSKARGITRLSLQKFRTRLLGKGQEALERSSRAQKRAPMQDS